jgi:hypothetical protein
MGCHTKDGHDAKGNKVKRAEDKACVECHANKDKANVSKKWKEEVSVELTAARNLEKDAIAAIDEAKGKAPDTIIRKTQAMLKDGQDNLRIVDAGGGVHNKKFSMLLVDMAVTKFEDLIAELEAVNNVADQ